MGTGAMESCVLRNRSLHLAITPIPQFPVSLTKQQVAFIRSARVARLATADGNGRPHVIPICFVFDGQNFYSSIDEKPKRNLERELKRLRNIRANPNIALIIDHYEEDWRRLAYVLIIGRARILAAGKNHQRAVRLLRRKYPQDREMAIDHRPMIRMTPRRVRAWGNL